MKPLTDTQWNILSSSCPSRTSLAKIANKWTAMIVIVLTDGPLRFQEIRELLDGISGKVLTDTLRDLQRDGILTRVDYDENPPRVEYSLSDLGRTLIEPLTALGVWAEEHFDEVSAARDAYDRANDPPLPTQA